MIRLTPWALAAAVAMAAAQACAQPAPASAPATASEPAYSSKSTIGELLDNPATKAVLLKYIPDTVNNPQIESGRDFPLEGIVQYVPELTPDVLKKINAELATIHHK